MYAAGLLLKKKFSPPKTFLDFHLIADIQVEKDLRFSLGMPK